MLKKKLQKLLQNIQAFVIGLLWIIFSVSIIISIISYHEYDPSLTVSTTSETVSNKLGLMGSYLSDFLIQFFGVIAILLAFIFFKLGQKIMLGKTRYNIYYKIIMFVVFVVSSTTLVSTLFPGVNYWGMETWGGAFGYYLSHSYTYIPAYILIPALLLIALFSTSIILDIRRRWWIINSIKSWRIFKYLNKVLFKFLRWVMRKFTPEKVQKKFKGTAEILEKASVKITRKRRKKKKEVKVEKPTFSLTKGKKYKLPHLDLLINQKSSAKGKVRREDLNKQAKLLSEVLDDFGIKGKVVSAKAGPIITLFEFEPAPGTKSSRVIGLSDDIARSMSAVSARIAVIPGKNALGIELPNVKRDIIYLKDILKSQKYVNSKMALPIILGSNISGEPVIKDLAKMPHLLVAGTTGSGKSVSINTMIMSILYRMPPSKCKLIMVDPKMLELSAYDKIPHLLTPVVTESGKAIVALKWIVKEMENRYKLMANLGVRNIKGYNEKLEKALKSGKNLSRRIQVGFDPETGEPVYEDKQLENTPMPYIVVIVDEMADLMITSGKEIEASVQRLAQMARAAGIHMIMATQRPSVDIITGVIKANFPTRISFQVTSKIDSRTILGEQGAEQLLGLGDMLYMAGGGKIIRAHGPFVSDDEIERIVSFIKSQGIKPKYLDEVLEEDEEESSESIAAMKAQSTEDALYSEAVEIIKRDKKVSISYIQRQLRIGYNKAANIVERMEREGLVSEPGRGGRRQILIS